LPAVSEWSDFDNRHGNSACFLQKTGITVHLNMSEGENGQLPLANRTTRSRISSERWEQIKTAYAK
jgi:hypothetical protein